jgi:hypothetical protein
MVGHFLSVVGQVVGIISGAISIWKAVEGLILKKIPITT